MKKVLIILVGIIIIGIGLYFVYEYHKKSKTTPVSTSTNSRNSSSKNNSSGSSSKKPVKQPEKPKIVPPISDFDKRLTLKWYGKDVTSADTAKEVCGKNYTGLHIGDDLEIFPDEVDKDVPVYAIADGTARQVGHVNGYGGLIVLQNNLNGQDVTVYYGHISLDSTTIKEGDSVAVGQQLALLGKQCSSETDGERKHLHFAIHKGTGIDVRGYVQTKAELLAWIDPKTYF